MRETPNTDVDDLRTSALDVVPRERDWSEGYGDSWDYVQVPSCPECGDYCRHTDAVDLINAATDAMTDDDEIAAFEEAHSDLIDEESWSAWRCADPTCERFGAETDPHEAGAEGPMMNYDYPLPDGIGALGWHEAADVLRGLPLCVVYDENAETYSLALTGGGMDLSWEICEGFTRLGFLPPVHFCNLPAMAGRGSTGHDGNPRSDIPARDLYIIAACRRAVNEQCERTVNRAHYTIDALARLDRSARSTTSGVA